MRRRTLICAALLAFAACTFGPKLRDFAPAKRPEGITVEVDGGGGRFIGELLEVREEGLLLRTDVVSGPRPRLLLVSYPAIRLAHFVEMPASLDLEKGRAPEPRARERLRRLSRFPQGLSEELLRRLLDADAQAELERVKP